MSHKLLVRVTSQERPQDLAQMRKLLRLWAAKVLELHDDKIPYMDLVYHAQECEIGKSFIDRVGEGGYETFFRLNARELTAEWRGAPHIRLIRENRERYWVLEPQGDRS